MLGLWFGINLVLAFLATYWFIQPDFLFTKKQLKRVNVFSINIIVAFISIVFFIFIQKAREKSSRDSTYLFFTLILDFLVIAWLFYRYGKYKGLLEKNKQQSTQPIIISEDSDTPPTHHSPINESISCDSENIQILPQITITASENSTTPNTINTQSDDDWQSYKQKMEQSWQDTRTKLKNQSNKTQEKINET